MARPPQKARSLFLVHGRDRIRVQGVTKFLESLDIYVIPWEKARKLTKKPTAYIGEILEAGMRACKSTLVLFTGDDVARLQPEFHKKHDPREERKATPQPRPNVIYEAGMAMGRDPKGTILVQIGELRGFTDIDGLHILRLNNSIETREALIDRLQDAGLKVHKHSGWDTAGNLE